MLSGRERIVSWILGSGIRALEGFPRPGVRCTAATAPSGAADMQTQNGCGLTTRLCLMASATSKSCSECKNHNKSPAQLMVLALTMLWLCDLRAFRACRLF